MIDQTLGHYRVQEKIGKGGMGVVYRARDEHLERDVALKVLPPGLLANENARRRFKKEALALSKLNHANIEAVYDFNSQDGVDFLVMEYVEGMTLTQKLVQGPLSGAEITALGSQIALALEEAHGKGIIHRDLKPGNIMVTPKGQVKVLDFGLATLLHQPGEAATQTSFGVAETGVAGTLPYVAPEQLRGSRADPRSDIYAAGAVLYEMATARHLFMDTDSAQLIKAILQEAPPSLTEMNGSIPPDLARVIQKALDKDPIRRYQSAKELREVLEKLKERLAGSLHRRIHPGAWILIAASALTATGIALVEWRRIRFEKDLGNPTLTRLITTPSEDSDSRISPDGKWVSISSTQAGKGTIWLHRPGVGDPEEKHHFDGTITSHVWSPGGNELAVLLNTGSGVFLELVPAMGGAPRKRLPLDVSFAGGRLVRWIGTDVYVEISSTGLWAVRESGESRLILAAESSQGRRSNLDLCADGKTVVYTLGRSGKRTLWISSLDGRDARKVPLDEFLPSHARWLSRSCDRLAFVSGQGGEADLWQVAAGGERPARITFSGGVKRLGETSPDGSRLTFLEVHDRANLRLLDPHTDPARRWQLTTESLLDFWPSPASGSGLLAFQRSIPTEGGSPEIFGARIFLARLVGNRLENLEAAAPDGGAARLSPGGEYLAYVRGGARGVKEVWVKDLRSGGERKAAEGFRNAYLYSAPMDWVGQNMVWSSDGSALYLVASVESGMQGILSINPLQQTDAYKVLIHAKGSEVFSNLYPSPDGGSLCFIRSDVGPTTFSALDCLELSTGKERRRYSEHHRFDGDLILRGFIDSGRSLLVLSTAAHEDWTERLKVLRVDASGPPTLLGVVDRTFGGTARLDSGAEFLYLAKADVETGVHNLYQFRLSDGGLRPLTDNPSLQIRFAGLEVLQDGRLIYSEQER
ncbi:MAG TPA: protein kinase, partial [Candidatus Polarisedimenticolia bacterium]|nr:protein kinase [Candidatus Polarisedimenticolia bacterium]